MQYFVVLAPNMQIILEDVFNVNGDQVAIY